MGWQPVERMDAIVVLREPVSEVPSVTLPDHLLSLTGRRILGTQTLLLHGERSPNRGSQRNAVFFDTAAWLGENLSVEHQHLLDLWRRSPARADQALRQRDASPQDGLVIRQDVPIRDDAVARTGVLGSARGDVVVVVHLSPQGREPVCIEALRKATAGRLERRETQTSDG